MTAEPWWADLAARLAAAAPREGRFVLLIDGGSGSGKTSLGRAVVADLRAAGRAAELVSLDAFYPGWSGLAAASRMVVDDVLAPEPGYRRWDWAADAPAEWVALDPAADLVIEGCGALTADARGRADLAVWLERAPAARKRLALARDGAAFAAHWDAWAAQERAHWARDRPRTLADLVVDVGGES